ncbi:protein scabrous [Acyrthosiphon pisum]|uniref:Fibrinogen C-terminal domain-containing protein n=1 Tax=Acyrthosiphon pisum TaxID=7029 RepID=A0A8R2A2H4_ACYPI|nr:protein scabrous [Acyrthosiphon pisum]|eukprot:XP_001944698.3 PREDICTED: protein scabrous [Acyrthosiphon pisum]
MRKLNTSHTPSAPSRGTGTGLNGLVYRVQLETKCSSKTTTMFLFLIINVAIICTFTGPAEAQTALDTDELRTIKNQLNLLMEKRQQDYQQLEKSLYESLKGSTDLDALKEEIQLIRDEHTRMAHSGNDGVRDKVAVGWLKEVIGGLRSEMQAVWSAINETAQIHKTVAIQNDLQALRNDLDSDRKDLQTMQGELMSVKKNVEEISTKHSELEKKINTIAKHQNVIDKKNNENDVQTAYSNVYKRVAFDVDDNNNNVERLRTNVITTLVTDREAQELEQLESSRKYLAHRMARLEKRMKGVLYRESAAVERENRLSRLEADLNATKEALAFNATRQDATQDRLHGSLLELLESVENLDDRVDACLPEVRKEISKIEFTVARINASVAIIKEDQNNQMLTAKALGEGMSAIQRKMTKYNSEKQIEKMVTISHIKKGNCTECTHAIDELATLQNSFERIVDGLPKDCSKLKSSGTYLIAPDGKNPLLVQCDISDGMSWITVQKRTNDHLKFNNNWNEYAKGFGNLYGDFWLGNDAIHRLTADNASSLRVRMTDIYGNNWRADYSNFSISNATDGYRLDISGYRGNATDALSFQNGHRFSTADRDQDASTANCAANYEGGWWYSRCQHANLNGKYNFGLTWFDTSRNQWMAIAESEMQVGRPVSTQ